MRDCKVIGIDLARTKFHIAGLNDRHEIIFKKAVHRDDFFAQLEKAFPKGSSFAFEACGGAHFVAQRLMELGYKVILLKPKDVKAYAKSRQKNDCNDAIAICKAACDPELRHVHPKTKSQQEIFYLHKSRQNTIQQRIQRSNSLLSSLVEFGYLPHCRKAAFGKQCREVIEQAYEKGYISVLVYTQMIEDVCEIEALYKRETALDKAIISANKASARACLLETIPGIGPINASVLSNKPLESYSSAKEFAASLGLVPRQSTTGGKIQLGSITKQGDRYARTMLIQAGRALVMRTYKPLVSQGPLYQLIERLKAKGKGFNVICVAVANKLARIAYGCIVHGKAYHAD
jgi:transposase